MGADERTSEMTLVAQAPLSRKPLVRDRAQISEPRDTKTRLAALVNDSIAVRHLGQAEAAKLLGLTQPKVSALANGKLSGFSVEKLMELLTKLGAEVEIIVRKTPKRTEPRIRITAA
jgi:predicted XRE-type DNA-binding protein